MEGVYIDLLFSRSVVCRWFFSRAVQFSSRDSSSCSFSVSCRWY